MFRDVCLSFWHVCCVCTCICNQSPLLSQDNTNPLKPTAALLLKWKWPSFFLKATVTVYRMI